MNKKTTGIKIRSSFDIPSIKDSITSYKPDIKRASVEFYISGIKKIIDLVSSKKDNKSAIVLRLSEIKKTKKIIGILDDSIKSISSRKNIVSSILVFLGSLEEPPTSPIGKTLITYQEYHKNLAKRKEDSYMDNEMTSREKENWITGEDISLKIKKLKEEIDEIRQSTSGENPRNTPRILVDTYQKYLVLNLYTLLPPLRNDYANVKVIKDCENFGEKDDCVDTDFNYINFCSKKLLLCTYKTRKFYGIKRVDIPEELFEIIKEWESLKGVYLEEKGCSTTSEGFLLINTTNCEKMLSNSLTKYINRIFAPKKVSTTMLRKIYLSEKYPVVVSYRDQARDAMIMGHSLSMQKMVYSKKIEK